MAKRQIKNITREKFVTFLESAGCKEIRANGPHTHYATKKNRPITINLTDPVPVQIVQHALRTLDISVADFWVAYDAA